MNAVVSAGIKFFFRFFLLYSLLIGLSLVPGVGKLFNHIYCLPTEKGLKAIFPKAYITVNPDKKESKSIRVEYASKKKVAEYNRINNSGNKSASFQIPGKIYKFKFYNLFLSFYIFFLTLMILSPLPRKELLVGILIGTVLFYLYTFFKAAVRLFIYFNDPAAGIYNSSPGVVDFFKNVLYFQTLGISILVVLLIWAGLVFRKGNWEKIFQ